MTQRQALLWISGFAMCGAGKLWWVDHDPWALFVAGASIWAWWQGTTQPKRGMR